MIAVGIRVAPEQLFPEKAHRERQLLVDRIFGKHAVAKQSVADLNFALEIAARNSEPPAAAP